MAWTFERPGRRPLGWVNFAIVLAVLTAYGSFDELSQPLVGRSCEFADWIADLAGAAAGISVFALSTLLVRRVAATVAQASSL